MDKHLCGTCGEPMARGVGTEEYSECGLDNVVLVNVPIWTRPRGHADSQIPAIDSLHAVMARALIVSPRPLAGAEVRFLRKYLGYSARVFGRHIGVHHVALSRIENGHQRIPRKFDTLVRLFSAQAVCERDGRAFPEKILPVLAALAETTLDLGHALRVQHLDLEGGDRMAEPGHAWRRSTAGAPA